MAARVWCPEPRTGPPGLELLQQVADQRLINAEAVEEVEGEAGHAAPPFNARRPFHID